MKSVWPNGVTILNGPMLLSFVFFKKNFNVYFWERERKSVSGGGTEKKRETQNPKEAPAISKEPDAGPELMNHKIMTRAKVT